MNRRPSGRAAAARRRSGTAGFTLIEVLVALALFALIAGAGFTMLDQVLLTQARTDGRLERLAEMQRAMHLLSLDFAQARGGSLEVVDGAEGIASVGLGRNAPETGAGSILVRYAVEDGVLLRLVLPGTAAGQAPPLARQPLLTGVAGVGWQFYDRDAGWVAGWPPEGSLSTTPQNPQAVELTMVLQSGVELRRVALLPGEPR